MRHWCLEEQNVTKWFFNFSLIATIVGSISIGINRTPRARHFKSVMQFSNIYLIIERSNKIELSVFKFRLFISCLTVSVDKIIIVFNRRTPVRAIIDQISCINFTWENIKYYRLCTLDTLAYLMKGRFKILQVVKRALREL